MPIIPTDAWRFWEMEICSVGQIREVRQKVPNELQLLKEYTRQLQEDHQLMQRPASSIVSGLLRDMQALFSQQRASEAEIVHCAAQLRDLSHVQHSLSADIGSLDMQQRHVKQEMDMRQNDLEHVSCGQAVHSKLLSGDIQEKRDVSSRETADLKSQWQVEMGYAYAKFPTLRENGIAGNNQKPHCLAARQHYLNL